QAAHQFAQPITKPSIAEPGVVYFSVDPGLSFISVVRAMARPPQVPCLSRNHSRNRGFNRNALTGITRATTCK
ncbi:hypothetical protein, partial [Novosphingobium sp. BW1]|uniref:hypothetical protein n=1 Tax=Novosphingobium sp. BW1 TaxID=2592621 RepID=UPI001966F575